MRRHDPAGKVRHARRDAHPGPSHDFVPTARVQGKYDPVQKQSSSSAAPHRNAFTVPEAWPCQPLMNACAREIDQAGVFC